MSTLKHRILFLTFILAGISTAVWGRTYGQRLLDNWKISTTLRMEEALAGSSLLVFPPPAVASISVRVNAGSDDAEENTTSGAVNLTSSDLELVTDGSANQVVGMRFNGINIPQGTTINSAYLEFECDEANSSSTSVTIAGQDADNPSTFTTGTNNISNTTARPRTTAQISWNSLSSWTVDSKYQSDDISSIVQEIVNRGGWSSGNSMVFFITGSGTRTAESYNGEAAAAPLLVIDYTSGGVEICGNGTDDDNDLLVDCDDPDCQDITITLTEDCINDGIALTASGGTAPYSYTWSDVPAPEAHWTFENTTDDVSGNGHHQNLGPSIGTPIYDLDVVEGQRSLSLDGSTYVRYSIDGNFMEIALTEWMISFWMKPASLTGTQYLFDEGGGVNGLALRLSDNILEFATRDNSTQFNAGTHTFPADGNWHHVAAVYANDAITLYLDGVAGTTTATNYVGSEISAHSGNGGIGRLDGGSAFGSGSNFYYTGLVDDFKYYFNQSLSADQIADEARNDGGRRNLTTGSYTVTVSDADGGCPTVETIAFDDVCPEICNNGTDDDGDGYSDCFDTDCPCYAPVLCDDRLYQSIKPTGLAYYNLYEVNTDPVSFDSLFNLTDNGMTAAEFNALAYSPVDRFIYGINKFAPYEMYRINALGEVDYLGNVVGLSGTNIAGAMGSNGEYYVTGFSNTLFQIDLTTLVATTIGATGISLPDFAISPLDGYLYGWETATNRLVRMNPADASFTYIGSSDTRWQKFGAFYFNEQGEIIAYGDDTDSAGSEQETLLKVDPGTGVVTPIGTGPETDQNDGCSCAYGLGFSKSVSTSSINHGDIFTYTFTFYNQTGSPLNNLTFNDELHSGFLWNSEPQNVTGLTLGATSINGMANANFTITDLPLGNTGSFTIDVVAPPGYCGSYANQATLTNIPSIYGASVISDDPNTSLINDSTMVEVINCTEICNNGIDDDGDGLIDCNDPDCNFITNNEFDNGTTDWLLYQQTGASATLSVDNSGQLSGTNSAFVNLSATNGNQWDIQLAQVDISIVAGATYTVSFEARATANKSIHVQAQERAAPWTSYWGENISLTTSATAYSYTFVAGTTSNNVGLMFDLGTTTTDVWIDHVFFGETCLTTPEICGNNIDDDGDGLIDSADPDCPAKFACDSKFYQTLEVSGEYWLYEIETEPVGLTPLVNLTTSAGLTDDINGAVFDQNDGYIYFIELHAPHNLYRMGGDFTIVNLGAVTGFPGSFYPNAAAIGADGNIYYRHPWDSDIFRLNLSNLTVSLVCDHPTWPEQTHNVGDLALNPADGKFYGTRDSTSILMVYDYTTCDTSVINLDTWIDGALGAFYISADGTGYGYANNTGNLYEINLSSGEVLLIGNGPTTAETDGCSCEGLKFTKEVNPGTITAGNSTTYTFTIYNNWNNPLTDIHFRDTLTQGLLWDSEPYNLTGGITIGSTSITGSANGVFTISNLPIGTTSFQIDASTPNNYSGPVPHYNQAFLENLPALLAPYKPSDYPVTPQIDDPTPLVIQPAVEICFNGIDDDGDGDTDCDDPDCNCFGGTDYGDAPASYGDICYTIRTDGNPYSPTRFGSSVDSEATMSNSINADGDGADEDGFTFTNSGNWLIGSSQSMTLTWTTNDITGHVYGWIDWDANGTFENDELVITDFLVGDNDGTSDNYGGLRQPNGSKNISLTVPNDALCGSTYARFTIQSDENEEGPTGTFCSTNNIDQDGEVEDYIINISGCSEICNNGVDDDNDGQIDCFDNQCQPIINSITPSNPTNCPGQNNGQISIAFSGTNLEFSINGGFSYQSSNVFTGLTAGNYNIRARNTVTGCFTDYGSNPVVLSAGDCTEICDNGIDDNGNGLIDGDDPFCPCSSRVTDGLLALYEFNVGTGSTINDISGTGTAVDLTVETPANTSWLTDCGLDVVTPTRLTSGVAATKISDGIMISNALTIEAWVKPDNTSFSTETRLVSLSGGGFNRNFTLAQWYDHYAVRVRTTDTDNNGGNWQITPSNTAFDNYIQHVIYTWDGSTGEERIIVDGQEKYSGTRTGNTSNWDNSYQLAIANEIGTNRDWLGELYLVAVYDKVLSGTEIEQNLEAGPCCGSYGNPEIDCSENRDLEIVYEGIQNNVPVTLNMTDVGTIDSIVVEIAYDDNNPGASISVQDALGNNYNAARFDVGPVRLYRTTLPATSSVTYSNQTNENEAQSIVAYVYRSTDGGKTILTNLTEIGGHHTTEYINFNLPASANPRNITVKLPVVELSYDDRILNFTATAGDVSTSLTKQWGPSGDNFPNGCCVDLVELTLLDVTSTVLNIAIESPSGSPDGQSIAVGGTTAIDIFCGNPEICSNGVDDDGDGLIDCADSDCGLISLANVTVGPCIDHPLQDVATLDVEVVWSGAPANDTIEVSISGKTEYIPTDLLASPQTITFNIPADGSTNNSISASWRSGNSPCSVNSTYDAPAACSTNGLVCNILYLCGDDKESDSDPWDHGWIEYIDQQNGVATLTAVLTKPDASGLGMYFPDNESIPMVVNFDDYEMIIISASTEDHISSDLVDTLKDLNQSILLGNYKLINDFGMSATEGFYQTQSHAFVDNSNQRTIYNFNNVNPSRSHVLTKGDYASGATAQLWANAGDQASGTDGNFFFFEETDPLTGIDNKHGRRVYLGYHMNGVYANSENGGALPVPAASWFDPIRHLTLDGKYYFDLALVEAAAICGGAEICNNELDDDGDGLIDCNDPDCIVIPAGATSAAYRTIANGNWTDGSIWQGGTAPPTGNVNAATISIEHDVVVQSGEIELRDGSSLWVIDGSLTLNGGDFKINRSTAIFINAELSTANGYDVDLNDTGTGGENARLYVRNSSVNVGKDFTNSDGARVLENVCLTVNEEYSNGEKDTLINVCATVGSNFTGSGWGNNKSFDNTWFSQMYIEDSEINLVNGEFENGIMALVDGSNLKIWVQNGDIDNNGFWINDITQYCASGSVNVPASYLPDTEECATIDWYFNNCDCGCTPPAEVCTGGIDEDGDGLFDCADPDCGGVAYAGEDVNSCSGESVNLTATATGTTGPYSFIWSHGLGSTAAVVANPLVTTEYFVTISNAGGCTDVDTVTIIIGACPENCFNGIDDDGDGLVDCDDPDCNNLNLTETIISPVCEGGSDGAIDLEVSGGKSPYTYSWSNGATTPDIGGLAAGLYEVTVTDDYGCTAVETYDVPDGYTLVLIGEVTNSNCYGDASGSINLTIVGGTPPYSYAWSNGATTEDISGLAFGAYGVTVSDANSCTQADFYTVLQAVSSAYEYYYIPIPETNIRSSFKGFTDYVGYSISNDMRTIISLVNTEDGNLIYYDHWEDGYEADILNPTQPTTQVWGDNDSSNGSPPGLGSDNLQDGDVIGIDNTVPLPRNPSQIYYDGRDKIASAHQLALSRAAWAPNPGPVLSGAVDIMDINAFERDYEIPIGEDISSNQMFEYTSLLVMAQEDNTIVWIDVDGNGSTDITQWLDEGETYQMDGGVQSGGKVTSSKPVQAHLITGDFGGLYENRWFTLIPTEKWDNSYFAPVGTTISSDPADVFIYNPNNHSISVNYHTKSGSGSFTVGSKDVYRYRMPMHSGAHFYTNSESHEFYAISTIDSDASDHDAHDWGYNLLPESYLTISASIGWGPGNSDLSGNGSPAWVIASQPTRLYVDYDGDPTTGTQTDPAGNRYDAHYDLTAYESKRIFDNNDNDQTGMFLYTMDGTLISAAWGQDPETADPGNPYLDFGTTVPPIRKIEGYKEYEHTVDVNGDGLVDPGDEITFYLNLVNSGNSPVLGVTVFDPLPPEVTYIPNTTYFNNSLVPDDNAGTAFPVDGIGYYISQIPINSTYVISFRTTVNSMPPVFHEIVNSFSTLVEVPCKTINSEVVIPVVVPPTPTNCTLSFSDIGGGPVSTFDQNSQICVQVVDNDKNTSDTSPQTIQVTVQNTSHGDTETVSLTETGNNTGIFRGCISSSTSSGQSNNNGTIYALGGHTLNASYTDLENGDNCSDNVIVLSTSFTKQLYLSEDGNGLPDQDLDRIDPVAAGDATTATTNVLASGSSVVFTQTPSMCTDFSMPVGGAVGATIYVGISSGSLPSNPNVTLVIRFGATNIATLTNPSYSGGVLSFSGALASNVNVPAGANIEVEITSNEGGGTFEVEYDSQTNPSRIDLPTTTVITIDELNVFSNAYPAGVGLPGLTVDETVYIRSVVTDPFGYYDINDLVMNISYPGGSLTNISMPVVHSAGCSSTFEYEWTVPTVVPGDVNIEVIAYEGYENAVFDTVQTNLPVDSIPPIIPCALSLVDGSGNPVSVLMTDNQVCIQLDDINENQDNNNAEVIFVEVAASNGDTENVALFETGNATGVFLGCINSDQEIGANNGDGVLYMVGGNVVTASFDQTSGDGSCSDDATVVLQTDTKPLYLTSVGQGLDRIDPVATNDVTTATVTIGTNPNTVCFVSDGFDSPVYSNNDGSVNWASDWQEIVESNGPGSGYVRVSSNSLRIGGYRDDDDDPDINGRGIWREVDLSGTSAAALGIDFNESYSSSSFSVTLSVSNDGGGTYTDLETFTFSTGAVSRYYDLTSYVSSNTRIRLLASGSIPEETTRQMFFDNIYIKYVCGGSGFGITPIKDASITSARPDNNFGGQGTFGVNSVYHSLLQFYTANISSTATVTSAQLVLNRAGGTTTPTGSVEVRALTQSWEEGNQQDAACSNGVTWNDADCNPSNSWSSAGGDYSGTVYATTAIVTGTNTWDLTSLVQAWVDGSLTNNGMLLRVPSGSNTHTFSSRESGNPPQLIIEYTDNGGSGSGSGSSGGHVLWLSTETSVTSGGAPGISSWGGGEILEFADPNLTYATSTDGTFSSVFNLDDFAQDGDARVNGIHYVSRDMQVGDNNIQLEQGDLLLATVNPETLTNSDLSTLNVEAHHIILFEPDSPGDYSAGTFSILVDVSDVIGFWAVDGFTLVEELVQVGTAVYSTLQPGDFLIASDAIDDRIYSYRPGNLGTTSTTTLLSVLVDGSDIGINSGDIFGLELIESDLTVGDMNFTAGQILVTLNSDDSSVGGTSVGAEDIFILDMTATGSSSSGTASLFFQGNDVNLDTWREQPYAFTLASANAVSGSGGGGSTSGDVLDEFTAISFSGNNGTQDWTGDWVEIGETDGAATGDIAVKNDARCTSGNCLNVHPRANHGTYRIVDLSGATSASLTYDWNFKEPEDNVFRVQISTDGSSWTNLQTISYGGSTTRSGSESHDISSYISANTYIRFYFSTVYYSGSTTDMFIDNVQVEHDGTNAGGSGGSGSCTDQTLTATEDVNLFEQSPNNNYGTTSNFQVGAYDNSGTRDLHTVMKFDVSGLSGRTITSAVLNYEVRSTSGAPITIEVHRVNTDWSESTATWNSPWTSAGGDFDAATIGSATITSSITLGEPTETMSIDITSLVQDWADGTYPNYGLILVDPSGQDRSINAHASEGSVPPTLDVSSCESSGSSPSDAAVNVAVSSSSDDAEEVISNGNVLLSTLDLEMAVRSGSSQEVGIRFNNISIPVGATITEAYIQFTTEAPNTAACNLNIYGENTDNAVTFTSSNFNISSRSKTSASVAWVPNPWPTTGEQGTDQRTPSLISIVQEIIDQGGWQSGNSMAFILNGSGRREAVSYDNDPDFAPRLIINFSSGSGTTNSDVTFVQSIPMCTDLTMPAGGIVQVTSYVSAIAGSIPANPDISAVLKHGTTVFANMTSPTLVAGNSGYATAVAGTSGTIAFSNDMLGAPDDSGGQIGSDGDFVVLDFGEEIPAGTNYTVYARWACTPPSYSEFQVEESNNNVTFVVNSASPKTESSAWFQPHTFSTSAATRYVKITKTGGACFQIDAVVHTSGDRLVWSQILSSNYTLPAGDAVSLEITQNDSGYSFDIEYDSETKPSKIDLPTQTVIEIEELAIYDSSYIEGEVIIDAENGETVYIRTTVSDPFGPEDVTSLDLTITAPSGTILVDTVLYDGNVVGTVGCNKVYEYEWVTGVEQGIYDIDVVAHEGYEGIQDEASTEIEIQFNDLGSPCQVLFSNGTEEVTTYDPNDLICVQVTDIDENEDTDASESLDVTLTSSSGDSEDLTLIETGPNTGVFLFCLPSNGLTVGSNNDGLLYAPMGDLLTMNYQDKDISADECSATALINSVNPEVEIAIELIEPEDGVALVGEFIQFDITVSNPGPTPLTYLLLNNTFTAAELNYTGSSLAPDIINPGSLLWNIPVTIPSGTSYTIEVYFTGASPADPSVANASVSGNDENLSPVSAGPVSDDVIITNPLLTVDKYLIDPATGPFIIGDTLTYQIDITNTGSTTITTLPLVDEFDASCLEFVDANPATNGAGAGTAIWDNLGPLTVGAGTSVTTRFVITDICSPIENIAAIDFAVDENGDPVPPVQDTVELLVESPPVAEDDIDSTGVGVPVTVDVLANDFDFNDNLDTSSVNTTGVLQPANGTVSFINPATGEIIYQPTGGFIGIDSFEYIICDLTLLCDTAMVTITIVNEDCTNGIDDDGDGLIDCDDPDCTNFNDGGWLGGNEEECGEYDPTEIFSLSLPSGGAGGDYNYYWEYSVNGGLSWITVPGATGETYDPPTISQTFWFRRAARRFDCASWVFSNFAVKSVTDCPEICDNGLDDDGDGLFDCDDDDCIPTVVVSGNISVCILDTTTISATVSGGTPPYEFIWDNGLGIGESHLVNPDTTTTYRVMVLTASGCFAVDSVIVSVVPCPEDCIDGIDNDGDGLIDCDDPDCQLVGQPRPQPDTYEACPGLDYIDQVSLNDENLQNPNFGIVTTPTRGSVSIDYQGIFVYSPSNFYCGVDSFVYEVCNQTTGCCDIASVYLNVGDTDPPVLQNVPADITIGCDESIPEIPALVYGIDGCPGIYVSFEEETTQQLGNACQNYTVTRTWQATDLCGNMATGTQTITVQDITAPEIFRVYTLENGKKIAGGIALQTSTNWKYVEFPLNFSEVPLVFPQVTTENEVSAVTVRVRNVTEEGFEMKLQEEEAADNTHAAEDVAWLALEPGDLTGALAMQAGLMTNVTSGTSNLGFVNSFSGLPAFLATMQTYEDSDPAAIRYNGLSSNEVNVFIQEEASLDAEIIHNAEEVAYIAVDPGTLTDEDGTYVAETGALNLDHNWTTVNLSRDYNKPVVVLGGVEAGNDPAVVRVRNVTSNSFEVKIQEWDYLNGNHPNDKVSYIVMEGSIPSVPEYFCDQEQVELIPEVNLFAVDNCDRQLEFIYTDSSRYTSRGLHIYRKWSAVDDCGNSTDVLRTDTCGLAGVRLQVNLHGSSINTFGENLMRDDLREQGMIPLLEPYSGFGGFTHYGTGGGETTTQEILDRTGQNAIVDWVFVEVRPAGDNTEIISTCSGLLERDGGIITAEGDSILYFPNLPEGDYFLSIRHRNHLGMITEFVEYLSTADPASIDFGDKYYAVLGDLEASNFTTEGRRALWVGDVDGDGRVIFQGPNNDIFQIFSHILSHTDNEEHLANYISEGYLKEDLNMDGRAIYQGPNNDRTVMIYNTILVHPGNSSFLANYIVNEILP
ncbi:MAG: DNRLRE domain-containing protein [Bacteroidota bacterium]